MYSRKLCQYFDSDDPEKMNTERLVFVNQKAAAGEAVRNQIINLYSSKLLGAIVLNER